MSAGTARPGLPIAAASRPPPISANAALRPVGEIDPSGCAAYRCDGSLAHLLRRFCWPLAVSATARSRRGTDSCSRVFLDPLDPAPPVARHGKASIISRTVLSAPANTRLDRTIRPIAHPAAQCQPPQPRGPSRPETRHPGPYRRSEPLPRSSTARGRFTQASPLQLRPHRNIQAGVLVRPRSRSNPRVSPLILPQDAAV